MHEQQPTPLAAYQELCDNLDNATDRVRESLKDLDERVLETYTMAIVAFPAFGELLNTATQELTLPQQTEDNPSTLWETASDHLPAVLFISFAVGKVIGTVITTHMDKKNRQRQR